uniref:rRNA biogenesis protein RRP36 n=1 Tax=Timema monikensis TaxID=170555 RepID=A0A7R9E387_9NEOP|nr:unnamed protein product [Timema monikensis]
MTGRVGASIRKELSNMSFEQLLQLKEELGTKVYNEAIFGESSMKNNNFKRANKNRPREMSSKVPVSLLCEVVPVKKVVPRDPRFDTLCGAFNEKAFKSSYSFLSKVKQQELKQLKEDLKAEKNSNRKEKIRYLIQRLENQEREVERLEHKEQKKQEERAMQIQLLREGKRPQFAKPVEKRLLELVDQYKELKKNGKLKKHIEKHRKKVMLKDKKKMREHNQIVLGEG